jgi:hypothetical protein
VTRRIPWRPAEREFKANELAEGYNDSDLELGPWLAGDNVLPSGGGTQDPAWEYVVKPKGAHFNGCNPYSDNPDSEYDPSREHGIGCPGCVCPVGVAPDHDAISRVEILMQDKPRYLAYSWELGLREEHPALFALYDWLSTGAYRRESRARAMFTAAGYDFDEALRSKYVEVAKPAVPFRPLE